MSKQHETYQQVAIFAGMTHAEVVDKLERYLRTFPPHKGGGQAVRVVVLTHAIKEGTPTTHYLTAVVEIPLYEEGA